MLCRCCGAPTHVLATREYAEGFVLQRRRECLGELKHRYSTYEVDDSAKQALIKYAMGPQRVRKVLKDVELSARNAKIVALAKAGEKHVVIAEMFSLSHNMVTHIARRHGLPTRRQQRNGIEETSKPSSARKTSQAHGLLQLW